MISRSMPARAVLVLSAAFALQVNAQAPLPNTPQPKPPKRFAGAGGDYKTYSQETLDNGKKVYTANCAFCHGGGAKGGESGPSLVRSVVVLHDENGEVLNAFIHVGRPEKGMPRFNLPDGEVKDMAAFLHDRVRAAAERGTYQILNIVVGDAKAGEAYFNGAGKCTTCHSVQKDLAHIGANIEPVDLQQKIVMPREQRGGSASTAITAKVTLPSGEVSQGRIKHIDDFSITIVDKDDKSQTFARESTDSPKVEVTDPLKGHFELLNQYTDSDIHNLTAYLLTLK